MQNYERYTPSNDQLKTFVAIAECGNLTRAASQLHKTQSAISVQLRNLEEGLKTVLFNRLSRGMSLNENGRKLLPVARRTLADIGQIAGLFNEPLRGRLRVGIPDDFDDNILERALAGFSKSNPHVEIIARSGCTSGFADDIGTGRLDIAVVSTSEKSTDTTISTEPTCWAASEALVLTEAAPVPLAILDRNCWWRDIPTNALDKHERPWEIVFQSSSFPSLRAAIRAGLAVGVLPKSCLEPGMKKLTKQNGFPALPSSYRSILIRPEASAKLTAAMAGALSNACAHSRSNTP